jgi:saccharopine dehydrogenase (NAD+, L-lysine-forming)
MNRVGIGGRSETKAKAVASAQRDNRAVPVGVDARDSSALVRELKRWDCVIHSSWYDLNVPVMEAAIEAGVHYCDLGGLYHQTLRQLKLNARARDAGVTCVLGIGSTPGTMNVMGAYGASKLDKVRKVLLRSSGAVVSGGEAGRFVAPYAIRTIFDEFSMEAPILRKGKIRFVPALSGFERSEFMPPVGVVEGYYTIHSELATMPKTIGKGVQEMDFIVAFPAAFRQTIETLVRLGLSSREEISVEGTKVRPYDVTATAIDGLPKPKEPELDVDIQRCVLLGERGGTPVTLRYEAVTWPHKGWKLGGGIVDTGVPPSIAAQWMVRGRTKGPGVLPPELAFDPLPFFKELSAQGRGIHVTEMAEETRPLN